MVVALAISCESAPSIDVGVQVRQLRVEMLRAAGGFACLSDARVRGYSLERVVWVFFHGFFWRRRHSTTHLKLLIHTLRLRSGQSGQPSWC
jgi:hypothetical protein